MLGAEGKIAIFDRIELGLNLPFVTHGGASFGGLSLSDTEFGDPSSGSTSTWRRASPSTRRARATTSPVRPA